MPTKPISEKRRAANRANAAKSTGPRTPEGKARASQNARKYNFTPANYAVVCIESPELVANLRDDAVATYQPANSQELHAVERIALAQLSMLRLSSMEAGLFSNYLDASGEAPESTDGDRAASGFRRLAQESNVIALFLRYQAQAERLYRRAVEDFKRLRKLRAELSESVDESVEDVRNEANPSEQANENTPPPLAAQPQNGSQPRPCTPDYEPRIPTEHHQSEQHFTSAA